MRITKISAVMISRKYLQISKNLHQQFATVSFKSSKIFQHESTLQLLSIAVFFKLCSSKTIVKHVSKQLHSPNSLLSYPLRQAVRLTAFSYFARENMDACISKAQALYSHANINSIIDYGTEDQTTDEAWQYNLHKKIEIITKISQNTFTRTVPLKCTSVMCSQLLEKITEYVNISNEFEISDDEIVKCLTLDDQAHFHNAIQRLRAICAHAKSNRVCLLLDAEQTFRQPAIEYIARTLSKEYNTIGTDPVIYNTYQAYLKRNPQAMRRDLEASRIGNYVFAVKLVRGAYMISETRLAVEQSKDSPILPSKEATDIAYDAAAQQLLGHIGSSLTDSEDLIKKYNVAVMIASHNRASIEKAITVMQAAGIKPHDTRVKFAQILGMSDHCSFSLGLSGYNVAKLIPFGPFDDLLPWLLRRLDENQVSELVSQLVSSLYF